VSQIHDYEYDWIVVQCRNNIFKYSREHFYSIVPTISKSAYWFFVGRQMSHGICYCSTCDMVCSRKIDVWYRTRGTVNEAMLTVNGRKQRAWVHLATVSDAKIDRIQYVLEGNNNKMHACTWQAHGNGLRVTGSRRKLV
jgi:hypothetical protein